jgi:hypothetical protein
MYSNYSTLVGVRSVGSPQTVGTQKTLICDDKQFALCTSAQCIPDPINSNKTICFCEVHQGKSLGHTPCSKRVPHTDPFGVRHVTSTFAFNDFATKKALRCPSGAPWSDCLDQPCVVNPLDPSKAICACKIVRTGASETFGGNCNPATCDKGYWSGASIKGNVENIGILVKALGLKKSPQQYCPYSVGGFVPPPGVTIRSKG